MASQSSQIPPAGVPPDEISRSSSALSMQHLKRPKLLHQSTRSSFLSLSGDQVLDPQDPLLTLKSMTRRGAILGLFDTPTGPEVTTCCALRTADGAYAFAPSEPCEELSTAIERIGENAVMSMASEVTSLVLAALRPGQRSLVIENTGTRIPILAQFADIQQSIVQSSGSCIITAAQCVLVWSNEPKAIINVAHSIEKQMLSSVAEHEISESMDYESAKGTQQPVRGAINEKDAVYRRAIEVEEGLDGTEADLSGKLSPRPVLRIHSLRIACVMILVIFAQCQGISRLIRQWSWDGNYKRFVLAVFNPPLAVLSLFFFLVVIGSIFQFIVPSSPCRKNSKYHSAVKPNPQRHRDYELPHITIQMPVYKEGLRGVIVPTMVSVMAAIERYEQQGGTASVFVNDDGMQCIQPDLAAARKQYYRENGIGYCARLPNMKVQKQAGCLSWFKKSPPVNSEVDNQDESELSPQGRANKLKFVRKGKFKKASNMNYCLTFSNRVEDEMMRLMELECQQRNCHESELTAEDDDKLYDVALENMLAADENRTWAEGNIRMGELILIIDCDTRVPLDCLLYGALEMHESPEVAILQHGSGVMQVAHNVFENAITFFTNIVYTAIKYSVGTGDVGPFVGHNAFLRWRAVQSVAFVDPIDGETKYWSDAHVSEDFDISLRIQIAGMICRLATYHDGGFQEGVSLTIYDELNRWEKYSYGCSELVFHPLYQWIYKGPVTRLFLRFLWSNIPVSSKVSITAYIFTYYAIAMGMVMTLANYFLVGLFANDLDHFYMPSWGIWVSLLVVFNGTASVALSLTRHRLKEEPFWHVIVESIKWLPFMILFFGGLGIHCGKALLCHILSINLEWASTSKELGPTGIYIGLNKMMHRFKYTFIFCIAVAAGMIYMATAAPWGWRIDSGAFSGGTLAIAPLAMQISCTFALPIFLGLT